MYLDGIDKSIRSENQFDKALNKFKRLKTKIVIVDEVQLVDNFASSLKHFVKVNLNISVFVTGSNSNLLSSEIINQFQGESESIILSPLTYKEIIIEIPDYPFNDYLLYGGLPIVVNMKTNEKSNELTRIYNEIYQRDILNKLSDKLEFLSSHHIEALIELIASSLSPVSPSSLVRKFLNGINKTRTDELKVLNEIYKILTVLDNNFFMKHIAINDYNDKIPLENIGLNKKYYFADNGLRYINCKNDSKVIGICLENAVFVELFSRGIEPKGKLILGKNHNINGEIDFNYELNGDEYHIQVTHTINPDDYAREISNLNNLRGVKQIIYLQNSTGMEEKDIEYLQGSKFFI